MRTSLKGGRRNLHSGFPSRVLSRKQLSIGRICMAGLPLVLVRQYKPISNVSYVDFPTYLGLESKPSYISRYVNWRGVLLT